MSECSILTEDSNMTILWHRRKHISYGEYMTGFCESSKSDHAGAEQWHGLCCGRLVLRGAHPYYWAVFVLYE